MKSSVNLDVIYLSKSGKLPYDVDFFALLSYVESNGIKPNLLIINSSGAETEKLIEQTNNFQGNIIYLHANDIIELSKVKILLLALKKKNCLMILGGATFFSIESTEILDALRDIDIIIREPEDSKVLVDLLSRINDKKEWEKTDGIVFRSNNTARPKINKNRRLSCNIDHVSSLALYRNGITNIEWYPIIVSRGCHYNCQYCGFQVPYRSDYKDIKRFWRKKSVKVVVDEIEYLVANGINQFILSCNQFFSKEYPNNAINLAKEIIKRKLNIKFAFTSKPVDIRRNFNDLFILKEAGLQKINLGIDSGIRRFHEMFKTESDIETNIEIMELLHKYKFKFDIDFIFFDPYLSIAEIKENILFLNKIKGYFTHQTNPFSAFLDSQILSSVLVLKYGMPIIQKLKADNLIMEYPEYSSHPASKFLDEQVKLVFSIYRSINGTVLPKIRHFFYNKALVEKFDFINLFLLILLDEIITCVTENKFSSYKDYLNHIELFTKKTFHPYIKGIFSDFEQYRNNDLKEWLNN